MRNVWMNGFELILKLGQVEFNRAVVTEDAKNLDIETIEVADVSQNLACSAVHARFKRKCDAYSCQPLFGKSKIIPKDMTIPRAELFAALLNTTIGDVAYLALKRHIKDCVHLTDSQVVLFWISNIKS